MLTLSHGKKNLLISMATTTVSSFKLRSKYFLLPYFLASNWCHCNLQHLFPIQYNTFVYVKLIEMQFAQKTLWSPYSIMIYYTYILKINWSSPIHFWLNLSKNHFPISHCIIFSVNIYQRKTIFIAQNVYPETLSLSTKFCKLNGQTQ